MDINSSNHVNTTSENRSENSSKIANSSIASVLVEDFSLWDAVGGIRGMVEAVVPSLVFLLCFAFTKNIRWTIIAAIAAFIVIALGRLVQRVALMPLLNSLFSLAICLGFVWFTHDAKTYYVPGFIVNVVYVVGLLISILVRVPALGIVIELFALQSKNADDNSNDGEQLDDNVSNAHDGVAGQTAESSTDIAEAVVEDESFTTIVKHWIHSWRDNTPLYRAYRNATLVWIIVFLTRLAVQVPLYLANTPNAVNWLGTARIVMGLPLTALSLWLSWLLIYPAYKIVHLSPKNSSTSLVDKGN